MARVLIIAKTRMSASTVCVGGLNLETLENIRLLRPGGSNQTIDTPFNIGQIWELDYYHPMRVTPPHIEDVIVTNEQYSNWQPNLRTFLMQRVAFWQGGPEQLFEGKLVIENTSYISRTGGLPNCSTGYWLPNNVLSLNLNYGEGKYYYQIDYAPQNSSPLLRRRLFIKYVGFVDPVNLIPAGSLLRVSLARWWLRPGAEEERCYLQLSGWYL